MKKETKRKLKRAVGVTSAVVSTAFVGMTVLAKLKKGQSVYDDDLKEKNPLEGKKVHFVESEEDKENADGVKGHLEAVGESNHQAGFYERYVKRGIDIVLSFGGLVALSPIMGVIALAIKVEDPGPVLFTQKRMGQNKKYFKLHKFRSMKMSTPHDVPTHMLDNPDQYITKVGKFLRAHSLDELPQIWDIFIGNMSVIGPRPGLWNQDILTSERDKYGANDVKPGLTGWAQINGRDELEIPDKAKLDGDYVQNMGPKMDAKVFLKSLHVFGKDDSVVEGGTGEMKKDETYKLEKFSVLMSVYKKENPDFFEAALRSNLSNQTRKPDEFILVCDGPLTDELENVIKIYQKKYPMILKVFRTKENQGLGKALKFGLEKCTYNIVLRSDSDDICVNNRFEIQMKFMEKHPEIAVCSSYIDEFDNDWENPSKKKIVPLKHDKIYRMAKFRNPINHMATAFRKDIILSIGSYKHVPYVEDYELWVRTMVNGYKMANIDKILVHARVGNGMVGRRGNKKYISSWRKLNDYMLDNNMINILEYYRNMMAVFGFVYMPSNLKEIIYKVILRK